MSKKNTTHHFNEMNKLSIFIFILIMLFCFPVSVYSEDFFIDDAPFHYDVEVDGIAYNLFSESASVANSGKYHGVIRIPSSITINGKTYDVKSIESDAFYKQEVSEIHIEEGIEYIGYYAFMMCESLEKIVLPKSVRYVGGWAFGTCKNIKEIDTYLLLDNLSRPALSHYRYIYRGDCEEIPQGFFYGGTFTEFHMLGAVQSIGENAFGGCTELRNITLSQNLRTIKNGAFANSSLTSIHLPSTIQQIGVNVFKDSDLTGLTVDSDFSPWSISSNAFIDCKFNEIITDNSKNAVFYLGTVAYRYTGSSNLITIKDGTTTIAERCFANSNVKRFIIPRTVSYIGEMAFHNSEAEFEFKGILRYVGKQAFQWCENLTTLPLVSADAYIGENAFESHSRYQSGAMNYIGDIAVRWHYYGDDITHVIIREGTKEIAAGCFAGTKIQSVQLPSSLLKIEDEAFSSSSIETIEIPSSVKHLGEKVFYNCNNLRQVTLSKATPNIPAYTFYNCSSLNQITIPESVNSIGEYAFYNCSNLSSVSGANGLEHIENAAFIGCSSLSDFPFETANVTTIGSSAFANCNFHDIRMPGTLYSIGTSAFQNNHNLSSIHFESDILDMGRLIFEGSNLQQIDWPLQDCNISLNESVSIQRSVKLPENSSINVTDLPLSSEIISTDCLPFKDKTVKHILISNNVKFLDLNCLWSEGIESITSYATTPPIVNYQISHQISYDNVTIAIPAESYLRYSESFYWNKFTKYTDLHGNSLESSQVNISDQPDISILPITGGIIIRNLPESCIVNVFSADGSRIFSQYTKETDSCILNLAPGLYFINVLNKTFKLFL